MNPHPSHKLPNEKRTQLLNVAREEFSERGFSQASLNAIIANVKMSKSSFYHYFENKTDLFHQTIEQNLAPILSVAETFDVAQLTAESFWPVIEQMAGEMTNRINTSPDFILTARMFYRSRNNPEDLAVTEGIVNTSAEWIAHLLSHGQQLGTIRVDLPTSFLMDSIMALGMSIDRWMFIHWDQLSEDGRLEIQSQIIDMFVRLLEPR